MTYTARKITLDRLDGAGPREYIRVERHSGPYHFFVDDFPSVEALASSALPLHEIRVLG
jgi:hypothetical protein